MTVQDEILPEIGSNSQDGPVRTLMLGSFGSAHAMLLAIPVPTVAAVTERIIITAWGQ